MGSATSSIVPGISTCVRAQDRMPSDMNVRNRTAISVKRLLGQEVTAGRELVEFPGVQRLLPDLQLLTEKGCH